MGLSVQGESPLSACPRHEVFSHIGALLVNLLVLQWRYGGSRILFEVAHLPLSSPTPPEAQHLFYFSGRFEFIRQSTQ